MCWRSAVWCWCWRWNVIRWNFFHIYFTFIRIDRAWLILFWFPIRSVSHDWWKIITICKLQSYRCSRCSNYIPYLLKFFNKCFIFIHHYLFKIFFWFKSFLLRFFLGLFSSDCSMRFVCSIRFTHFYRFLKAKNINFFILYKLDNVSYWLINKIIFIFGD